MQGQFAYNEALLRARAAGIVMDPIRVILGAALVKPPQEDVRDERADEEKGYEPWELRALWATADETERLWIALGLNFAFDNAGLAHVPREVFDRRAGNVDYRRRKRGKVRRAAPTLPQVQAALDRYERPAPADPAAYDGLLRLTPTGLPLQRLVTNARTGRENPVDYVAMQWTRLMQRAGLREPPAVTRVCASCGGPREAPRNPCWCGAGARWRRKLTFAENGADGASRRRRGYRGLRTTFANLAPPNFREEVEIVMGHAQGTVLLDSYLERYGWERLRHLVTHV